MPMKGEWFISTSKFFFTSEKKAVFLVRDVSSPRGSHTVSFKRNVGCSKIPGLTQRWCVNSTQVQRSGDLYTNPLICAVAEEWAFSPVKEGITVKLSTWFISLTLAGQLSANLWRQTSSRGTLGQVNQIPPHPLFFIIKGTTGKCSPWWIKPTKLYYY